MAGQHLRLIDTAGNTCAAAPKDQHLTVLSVIGAVITFSTDITAGDGAAATNCAVGRTETYVLPVCAVGDPPAMIYTVSGGKDVLMTGSTEASVAAWRALLTEGATPDRRLSRPDHMHCLERGCANVCNERGRKRWGCTCLPTGRAALGLPRDGRLPDRNPS